MPSVSTLMVFSTATVLLLVIPGPAVLFITTRSAAHGRRAGMISVLGVHTGTLVHVGAAVAGLSALIMASAVAFTAVKYLGAIYLIGLGARTILARTAPTVSGVVPRRSGRRLYGEGIVVNVLNPKTAIFFLAFLPQFVTHGGEPVWVQTLVLGLVFILLGLVSDTLYVLIGATLGRRLLDGARGRRHGPVVEGGVLIGLGVASLAVPNPRAR